MIPKKIHYCWFGKGEKIRLAQKCIASWKKYCPEYEIIEWNEDNFNIECNAYTKMCYEQKKYAFLTDYIRLLIISQHGGIYFDTDVEIVKSFDDLLDQKSFFGFEDSEHVNTGEGFGAEADNEIVQEMIQDYDFLMDGRHGTVGCPILNTKTLEKFGLVLNGEKQDLGGNIIYPAEYFNPYDDPTGVLTKTENTHSIHWYGKSWMDKKTVLRSKITRPLHRLLGKDFFSSH